MDTHHDSHTGSEPAAAASWFMAMALMLVVTVALVVALFVWAPWNDGSISPTNNSGGNAPAEQGGGDTNADGGQGGIDIEGNDVDIGGGQDAAPAQ